ncbi:hypothetical protein HX109_03785 [Galbibacter sp. BG1]|uniref:hypothetical protein n=1 Tax=Galbibacter sp. BG1 TaxID=1170699 RepID=UPI0015BD091A|nr:hypothetical protein [Galbibacter sp. BG1]QLE00724.1 hypothetical protein HX109_03785 [Galbibacter sp. BG1]
MICFLYNSPLKYVLILSVWLFSVQSLTQVSPMHEKGFVKDTTSKIDHPYILPIYGEKVKNMGHRLPLPFGFMFNYVLQETRLNITKLKVGIGGSDLEELDFVQFDPVVNTANVFNVRADAWLFPFLNLYAIYAHSEGNANIDITFPINLNIATTPSVDTYGGGMVLAYGRNNYFGAANLNLSSSHTSALDEPVFGMVTSLRVGRVFDLHGSDNRISFSVGAQNQYIERLSAGSLKISDGFASLDPEKLDDLKQQIGDSAENWYDDLSRPQQLVVDQLVARMEDWLDGKDIGDTEIRYEFEKETLGDWSLQVGVQYMHGDHYWYRLEGGFGRGRTQLLFSFNYRFGL